MIHLDKVDRVILARLQEDAKVNVKELAASLNMTKTPVYERIRRLEQEGVISKYVALLDRKKLPPTMIVYCAVTLDVQKADCIDQFCQDIAEIPEVVECYLTGGVFDFLLKVVVESLDDYHEFASHKLATLANVGQIQSSFVLAEFKHLTSLPL